MFEIYKYNVVIVFCFIIRDRKVLLIKRKNPPSKNEYTVIGGKKERYESLAEACKREVFEETGLILSNIELVGVANSYILGSEILDILF
jgi:ADP-ribose pyrophosphatase YjhB (NUDIX family)